MCCSADIRAPSGASSLQHSWLVFLISLRARASSGACTHAGGGSKQGIIADTATLGVEAVVKRRREIFSSVAFFCGKRRREWLAGTDIFQSIEVLSVCRKGKL
ncbi:hypothetical protein C8F01DRAFT_1158703 [Mycena amicta]|nr:hypothetical protein C8F01DRAFT_1158703 [Mycena amicta]